MCKRRRGHGLAPGLSRLFCACAKQAPACARARAQRAAACDYDAAPARRMERSSAVAMGYLDCCVRARAGVQLGFSTSTGRLCACVCVCQCPPTPAVPACTCLPTRGLPTWRLPFQTSPATHASPGRRAGWAACACAIHCPSCFHVYARGAPWPPRCLFPCCKTPGAPAAWQCHAGGAMTNSLEFNTLLH